MSPVSVRWFSFLSLGTLAAMLGSAVQPPRALSAEAIVFCSDRSGPWRIWMLRRMVPVSGSLPAEASKITMWIRCSIATVSGSRSPRRASRESASGACGATVQACSGSVMETKPNGRPTGTRSLCGARIESGYAT